MSNDNDDLEGADIWGDAGGSSSGGGGGDSGDDKQPSSSSSSGGGGAAGESKEESGTDHEDDAALDDETRHMSTGELRQRIHLLGNDIRIMKSDIQRITHESRGQRDRIRENQEKVKLNKQLPYLVGNVVEVLEPEAEDGEFGDPLLIFGHTPRDVGVAGRFHFSVEGLHAWALVLVYVSFR